MAEGPEQLDWIAQAHALSDDVTTDEQGLLAELAGVVEGWPASNQVARKALRQAALALLDEARKVAS